MTAADKDGFRSPEPSCGTPGVPEDQAPAGVFAGVTDDLQGAGKYLAIFADEAEASLEELAELLLASEQPQSRPAVEKLLVAAHRLKGSAAAVGLHRLARLAHMMEDLLERTRFGQRVLTPEVIDILLRATDFLRDCIAALRSGQPLPEGFAPLGRQLEAAGACLGAANGAPDRSPAPSPDPKCTEGGAPPCGLPEALRQTVARLAPQDIPTWIGEIRFRPGLPLVGLKARLVFEKLGRLGTVCYFEPPSDQLEDCQDLAWVRFGLSTEQSREAVVRHARVAGIESFVVERLLPVAEGSDAATGPAGASQAEASPVRAPSGYASSPPSETLRVDIQRLDRLMTLAGQLVVSKGRFAQIAERLRQSLGSRSMRQSMEQLRQVLARMQAPAALSLSPEAELAALREQAGRLHGVLERIGKCGARVMEARVQASQLIEAVHHLDRLADALQQSVMGLRMVPIGPLFARFKRLVRDMARGGNKALRLVIQGEKTELDKRMIDELADPLIQLVRNAADHGIEPPQERLAAGKPAEGTITLDAFHRGNRIVIQVRDDGRGLNPQRIVRKALEKGLLAASNAERLTAQQIYDLVWLPGLSTAEKATEFSGRGMGLDIVKARIEALNGTVEIQSTPGVGTTFSLYLPLTLAILPSLMVESQGEVFALPLEAVRQIVAVSAEEVATVQGRRAAMVHGRVIPIVRLDEVLLWTAPPRGTAGESFAPPLVVVVGDRGQAVGLEVDRVLGEEDVVIQSLAANFRNVPGVAGASVLGNGRVSLVLDISVLLERAAARAGHSAAWNTEMLASSAGHACASLTQRMGQPAGAAPGPNLGARLAGVPAK